MPGEEEKKRKITKEEVKSLVEMLRYLMDAYGFFAEKLGEIQKSHKESYDFIFSLEATEKLPEVLSEMVEKFPEASNLYTNILIRMTGYMPKINSLMTLSADEKIELGRNLKALAEDLGELHNWIEKKVG